MIFYLFLIFYLNTFIYCHNCPFKLCEAFVSDEGLCVIKCQGQSKFGDLQDSTYTIKELELVDIESIDQNILKDLKIKTLIISNSESVGIILDALIAIKGLYQLVINNVKNIQIISNIESEYKFRIYKIYFKNFENLTQNLQSQHNNLIKKIQPVEICYENSSFEQIDLSELTNLFKVELIKNKISKYVTIFISQYLSELSILDWKCEYIYFSSYQNSSKLNFLYMANNSFQTFYFTNLTEVRRLDFINNTPGSLPDYIFKDLKKLKFLNLSYNKLTGLDCFNFSDLPFLDIFDLSFNLFSKSIFIPEITSLNELFLDHNYLDYIENLPSRVRVLDLSYNNFSSIFFLNSSYLSELNLNKNSFKTYFPDLNPNMARNLLHLTIKYNSIKYIYSDKLKYMKNLRSLKLSNNLIEFIEFPRMDSLTELYIDNNCLRYIKNRTFQNLTYLNSLSLSSNFLYQIDFSILNLHKLAQLNLSFNYITSLGQFTF